MSILADHEIKALCETNKPMISPFVDHQVRVIKDEEGNDKKIISYGLDSYGYDIRLADDIKLFTNLNSSIVDPKNLDDSSLISAQIQEEDGYKFILLPPNSYLLGRSIEAFNMPDDVTAICLGKSTYARSALIVNPTSFKPGFSGSIVLEIANSCSLPVKIYINEGIASCIFFRGNSCLNSYNGVYQNQVGVALPKI